MHNVTVPPVGYHRLSSCISADANLQIYRRFAILNARNLLYLQSQLTDLESRINICDAALSDTRRGVEIWSIPRSWRSMKEAGTKSLNPNCQSDTGEPWRLAQKLKVLLKEYNEALQQQAWLLSLPMPDSRSCDAVLSVNKDEPMVSDFDIDYLKPERIHDLAAVAPYKQAEVLSSFLNKYCYKLFRTSRAEQNRKSAPTPLLSFYSDSRIALASRIAALIFSSAMPILSIVVLYEISSMRMRLAFIVLFSAICSGVLGLVTDARNVEIIATTAAFAAVQVVFVSVNQCS